MENIRFYFDKPLIKATIESRINRFIFIVNLNGTKVEAHCPSGGTIAGIPRKEFKNIDELHKNWQAGLNNQDYDVMKKNYMKINISRLSNFTGKAHNTSSRP